MTARTSSESNMRTATTTRRRLAAWAGTIAPLLFVGTFTVEGFLRSGYDPARMHISALSLGPRGWIQVANFIVFGLLLFVFTRGLPGELQVGKGSKAGPILLTTLSALFLISGPFVMDPTGTPLGQATIHGTIHGLAGGIVFLLMPITCFVYLRRFLADPNWQSLRLWTLVLGTIEAVGVFAFTIVSKLPQQASLLTGWLGLLQRIALVPFMLWLFVFGLQLLRRSQRD
jgi:Protein of unknown function (DUF998)